MPRPPSWILGPIFAIVLLFPYTISSFLLTGDLRDVYLPLEDFYRTELGAGRLPLWDPNTALGFPALASAQIGFWYPPLFVLRFLPPEPALAVAYVFHGIALALGLFFYSRSLGISRAGSLLASIAFTGSGFAIGHLVHANIFFATAWLPWALLTTDRLAHTLRPRTALVLSFVLALPVLAGHLHIAFVLFALCGIRFITQVRANMRTLSWQHTLWTAGVFLVLMGLGVVLLAAVQLLPTFELAQQSTRGPGGGFDLERANQHSFPPWQAMTFLVPAFFGFPDLSEYWGTRPQIEMAAWIGAIPLLLSLVGMAGSWRSRYRAVSGDPLQGSPVEPQQRGSSSDRAMRSDGGGAGQDPPSLAAGELRWAGPPSGSFWATVAVLGFLLALGRWSPFRLLGFEPTLGIFSGPARYLMLTEFSLAILAGFGFDRLHTVSPRLTRFVGAISLAAVGLIVGGFVVLRTFPEVVQHLGERAVDALVVGRPEHVLSRAAYSDKVTYLLGRLSTWGVNLRNPSIALSFILLSGSSIALIVSSRGSAIIRDSTSAQRRAISGVIVLATAVELIVIGWQVHPRVPWSEVGVESPVVATLKDRPWGRLYVVHPQGDTGLIFASPTTSSRDEHERLLRDLAVTNIFTRAGIPGIEWPASLDLAAASTVLNRLSDAQGHSSDEGLLDRLAARYVAASSPLRPSHSAQAPRDRPGYAGQAATPGLRPQSQNRQLATFSSADEAMIVVWERPTARPRVELLERLPQDIGDPLPATVGTARITTGTPQRIHIAVANPTDHTAVLVLRDTFYPGWQATLDGNPVPIERADTLFRGVRVSPGQHTVTFTYRPLSVYVGIAISGAAWAALALVITRRPREYAGSTLYRKTPGR